MPTTTTGDISPRTSGYMAKELLKRAQPLLCLSRLGQSKPLPRNVGSTMRFRGYQQLPNQPKALTEGVTPAASKPTYRDVNATIGQYGDWIELTDVLADTHEDPLIAEFSDILGEQSAIMLERVIAGVLKAGTNVHFAGRDAAGTIATSRDGVNLPLTLDVQRRVMRGLRRQNAQRITSVVSASPNFNTSPIPPSFIAVCHTDMEQDIREMPGFVPPEKYGSYQPMDGEIGSVEGVRYIGTTILEPWPDAGAAPLAGQNVESNAGACADVYPVLYFGKNAFGNIPYAKARNGASPVLPMVLNPNVPRGGDPLGQRGSISWKAYMAAVILYDFYMARVECATTKY